MENHSIHNETALFARIANGDDKAFSELYHRYWNDCFMTAFRLLQQEKIAEDVVQEVFIKIWEKRTEITITRPTAYLRKAVHNRVLNVIRRMQSDERFYARLAAITGDLLEENPHFLQENKELLEQVIQSLPDDCRETFLLSRVHQLTYKEIAIQLQVSEKTVEKRISKALQHIRKNFYQYMLMIWASLPAW